MENPPSKSTTKKTLPIKWLIVLGYALLEKNIPEIEERVEATRRTYQQLQTSNDGSYQVRVIFSRKGDPTRKLGKFNVESEYLKHLFENKPEILESEPIEEPDDLIQSADDGNPQFVLEEEAMNTSQNAIFSFYIMFKAACENSPECLESINNKNPQITNLSSLTKSLQTPFML